MQPVCPKGPGRTSNVNQSHFMNRRHFLTKAAPLFDDPSGNPMAKHGDNRAAGVPPSTLSLSSSGLEPYSGPWGFDQAAHLLRRTMFGATHADIKSILGGGSASAAVDRLLAPKPTPGAPKIVKGTAEQDWVNGPYVAGDDNLQMTYCLSWWVSLMLQQEISIVEKMTLFWHNHFSCAYVTVKDARYMYRQNSLLRSSALLNYKTLVRDITLDPAMLRYLNGSTNTKAAPNENYGRELQELFTIGKGPEIAPGNYTNYTEADVKAAARVLTGWSDDTTNIKAKFNAGAHDLSNKAFSAAYGNTVIQGGTGEEGAGRELDDLLDMILSQEATARYIVRKIYRWFVDYVVDANVEQNVIGPLADLFRSSNFEIRPVLSTLLNSAHFFDQARYGCVIKNPIDLVIGTFRVLPVPDATAPTVQKQNWVNRTLRRTAATMQMDLMNPPNVAGWPAYWQEPVYHEMWINADTLQKRVKLVQDLSTDGFQMDEAYGKALIDVMEFFKHVSDPSDPNALITETARLLFPVPLTDAQRTQLNDVLLPGLPDYEWTVEWNAWVDNPTDANRKLIEDKLRALLRFMLAMPEYQLS